MIVEDLRARPARAGVAHLPEIVRGRDADDLALGQAGDLPPEIERLVVLGEDGDEELVLGQAEFLGDQLPGELDRVVLEIVAEGEVAEHLEEGVVPGGVADIVEIVVLAAGADAFLRRYGAGVGPLLDAGEDVLELHHAGIGEHQRRIVARHERARGHDLVPMLAEVVEKGRPDFVDAAHGQRSSGGAGADRWGAVVRCLSLCPARVNRRGTRRRLSRRIASPNWRHPVRAGSRPGWRALPVREPADRKTGRIDRLATVSGPTPRLARL